MKTKKGKIETCASEELAQVLVSLKVLVALLEHVFELKSQLISLKLRELRVLSLADIKEHKRDAHKKPWGDHKSYLNQRKGIDSEIKEVEEKIDKAEVFIERYNAQLGISNLDMVLTLSRLRVAQKN